MRPSPLLSALALTVGFALAVAACGEKEEDLSAGAGATTTGTVSTPVIALQPEVVEARARDAASAALPKGTKVRPVSWEGSCSGGETGGEWTCRLSYGRCSGTVTVSPPSGPEGGAITTDASGIRCAKG